MRCDNPETAQGRNDMMPPLPDMPAPEEERSPKEGETIRSGSPKDPTVPTASEEVRGGRLLPARSMTLEIPVTTSTTSA